MTPGARVAAAIEVIDLIVEGEAAEKALTSWARRSRFAGSKDRAAVRDHVFSALRNWRSDAVLGNGTTGRARMIGRLRAEETELDTIFNGVGHAPAVLEDVEQIKPALPESQGDQWNLQDWLLADFEQSLAGKAEESARLLQSRAPISVRVNVDRTNVARCQSMLAAEGIVTRDTPLCPTALIVIEGERKLRNSEAYTDGLIELQDAASQALVQNLPTGEKVLDYCAGGGGKALAIAALGRNVTAHDIDFDRMSDLPNRAERAQAKIKMLATDLLHQDAPFDVVVVDAPCSGSGAWRRSPEGKWRLSQDRLTELQTTQSEILDQVIALTSDSGSIVYATCSVLKAENEDQITAFLLRHPDWTCDLQTRMDLSADADGFFVAHLSRAS